MGRCGDTTRYFPVFLGSDESKAKFTGPNKLLQPYIRLVPVEQIFPMGRGLLFPDVIRSEIDMRVRHNREKQLKTPRKAIVSNRRTYESWLGATFSVRHPVAKLSNLMNLFNEVVVSGLEWRQNRKKAALTDLIFGILNCVRNRTVLVQLLFSGNLLENSSPNCCFKNRKQHNNG